MFSDEGDGFIVHLQGIWIESGKEVLVNLRLERHLLRVLQ
jgi:hypothetical protein